MTTPPGDPGRGSATLTFHGAAGTVTGSRFLVQTSGARILVDVGLFQVNGRGAGATGSHRSWTRRPSTPSS